MVYIGSASFKFHIKKQRHFVKMLNKMLLVKAPSQNTLDTELVVKKATLVDSVDQNIVSLSTNPKHTQHKT